ncbi:hypothetical protein HOY82DRAFT_611032 [Tuber indicum]|nr:hypothetical protein HOY82DRAFT_611032 [Tuber indicum]
MSHNSREGVSGRYVHIAPTLSFSFNDGKTIQQQHNSSLYPPHTLLNHSLSKPGPPALACPVQSCPSVFKGEMSCGYLWRHLKRPRISSRTGDEKAAWLRLHRIEHDRLLALGVTPAQRKREARKMRARKASRAAGFELWARSMGITEKKLIAQKVAIWEGMYAAKQSGDSIGVSILYSFSFWRL